MKNTAITILILVIAQFSMAQNTIEENVLESFVLTEVVSYDAGGVSPTCNVTLTVVFLEAHSLNSIELKMLNGDDSSIIISEVLTLNDLANNSNVVAYNIEDNFIEITLQNIVLPELFSSNMVLTHSDNSVSSEIEIF